MVGGRTDDPLVKGDSSTAAAPEKGDASTGRGYSTSIIVIWSAVKPAVWFTTSTILAVSDSVSPPSGRRYSYPSAQLRKLRANRQEMVAAAGGSCYNRHDI